MLWSRETIWIASDSQLHTRIVSFLTSTTHSPRPAPCWTTTVRGCVIIPVFGLRCTNLVAQGANECIGNDRARSREGKTLTIPQFSYFLFVQCPAQPIPLEYLQLASFDEPPEPRGPRGRIGSLPPSEDPTSGTERRFWYRQLLMHSTHGTTLG